MAKVLAEGWVLGVREYTRKDGSRAVSTNCAVGDRVVSVPVPMAGFAEHDRVLIYGDLRRWEGREYFADGTLMFASSASLEELVTGLRGNGTGR